MKVLLINDGVWKIGYVSELTGGRGNLGDFLQSLGTNYAGSISGLFSLFDHISTCEQGPRELSVNLCKQISGPIREFRKGKIRVLWFYDEGNIVIASHAFLKQTRTTPIAEIKRAEDVYKQYLHAKTVNSLIFEQE